MPRRVLTPPKVVAVRILAEKGHVEEDDYGESSTP